MLIFKLFFLIIHDGLDKVFFLLNLTQNIVYIYLFVVESSNERKNIINIY